MSSRGRRPASLLRATLMVVIVVAGTLFGSAMVSAASPAGKSVIGTSHGLTYVKEATTLPDSDPFAASATADCPKHTAVTGGGAFTSGPTFGAWLNSSSPEPAGGQADPKKGWIAFANNLDEPTDESFNVYAICTDKPSKIKYAHKEVTVPESGSGQAAATAACPKHTAVTGGGAFLSGPASDGWLNSSSPEPAGGQADPKKGWIAYARNIGDTDHTLDVYAICSQQTSKLKYVHKDVTLPTNAPHDAAATAACPKHTAVLGGGAFVSGDPDSGHAWLNSSSPEPAGGNATPKKGWIAYAESAGGPTDQTLHVYAICTK